jgi:long-chain acyl-CoA synthetase
LKTIQKQKPTLFPGAPTIYIGLLNHPELKNYDLSSIDSCLSGSAPLPVEVQQQFEDVTGGKLVEGYGLTESSPVTHSNFLWDKERIKGSVGVPWPSTDAAIFSLETGEPLPPNEMGEIVVKGPQVMKGYWNRPEETEQTLRDGWLLTGDLGYMDERGYFYVVDRKKDMIIAGGFNIYPREIEEVLYEHPAIQEVVAAGVPDEYRGETVKAYVVLKEGEVLTEEELNEFARKYLAAYKVPRIYEFRKELPKTAVGKILRRALVEEERQKIEEEQKTS